MEEIESKEERERNRLGEHDRKMARKRLAER